MVRTNAYKSKTVILSRDSVTSETKISSKQFKCVDLLTNRVNCSLNVGKERK